MENIIMNNDKLAVIFPGQSSQYVGMLSNLAIDFKLVKETFSKVSDVLNYDIWRLIQNGPVSELNKTYHTQPAILTASVVIWKIWKKEGGSIPKIMAGHSLGEYSALVCAGSIDLLSAVKLVAVRGLLMQRILPYGCGSMSVIIGLHDNIVLQLCKEGACNQIVAPASFNAPGHVVIAGHKEAVDRVNVLCKNAGAKHVLVLPISVPSHCILMKPMLNEFKLELDKIAIKPPIIPVVNNTYVSVEHDPVDICNALLRQLYTPVRWNDIIRYLIHKKKIVRFLEMGPGSVLTNLMRRNITNNVFSLSVNDSYSLLKAIKEY